jgi:hypothetical protein
MKCFTGFAAFSYNWFSRLRLAKFLDNERNTETMSSAKITADKYGDRTANDSAHRASAKKLINLFNPSCPYLPYKKRLYLSSAPRNAFPIFIPVYPALILPFNTRTNTLYATNREKSRTSSLNSHLFYIKTIFSSLRYNAFMNLYDSAFKQQYETAFLINI